MSHTIHKTMDLSIFKTLIVRLYRLYLFFFVPAGCDLETAAVDGCLERVNELIAWGAVSELEIVYALRWSVCAGHIEITKALIAASAGAHLNAKNCFNFTALMFAALLSC